MPVKGSGSAPLPKYVSSGIYLVQVKGIKSAAETRAFLRSN